MNSIKYWLRDYKLPKPNRTKKSQQSLQSIQLTPRKKYKKSLIFDLNQELGFFYKISDLQSITDANSPYICVVKHKELDDMIKKMKNFFVRGLQHIGDNELQAWKLNNK